MHKFMQTRNFYLFFFDKTELRNNFGYTATDSKLLGHHRG
jgi:hypothetical protein